MGATARQGDLFGRGAEVSVRLRAPIFQNLEMYRLDRWHPMDGRPTALNLSGGRSSAYQVWHIVEANGGLPQGFTVNFQNTSKEDEETLIFIDKLDQRLGLGVHYLEFNPDAPNMVERVRFETAARNGEVFQRLLDQRVKRRDGTVGVRPLPNPTARYCTGTLKIRTFDRYARKVLGWPKEYWSVLGYRFDERGRYDRRVKADRKKFPEGGKGLFPMYHAGADQVDVQRFFMHAPIDLGIDSLKGNCDYCLMVATWKIKERMLDEAVNCQIKVRPGAEPPPKLRFWIAAEERVSDRTGPFRRDRPTYRQLWDEVCAGNLSAVGNGEIGMECGTCTD